MGYKVMTLRSTPVKGCRHSNVRGADTLVKGVAEFRLPRTLVQCLRGQEVLDHLVRGGDC